MPSYLPLGTIRSMPYAELERWWEVDFNALTSTAVAEATGPVHPTVTAALMSEDWLESWADALYAAYGGLASSVERMTFEQDRRLTKTQTNATLVQVRMGEVNTKVRAGKREQGWTMLPANQKDARGRSLSLLAGHHADEALMLADSEIARRGLTPNHPFYGPGYENKFDAIEDAVRRGMLQTPMTSELEKLLRMPSPALTSIVARDVTSQDERCVELRHPMMLRHWRQALEQLRDRHCELAGVEPSFMVNLPKVDMQKLWSMDRKEAGRLLSRRRFVRAIAQRYRECEMHARDVVRAVSVRREEIVQPWYEARMASREELARRHPEQFEVLLAAFTPFCDPGTTRIRREFLTRHGVIVYQLVPLLKRALADGSWVRLRDGHA